MEKGKGFFRKPKRAAVIGICLVGALAILGAEAVLARAAIVKETSIGEENAKNFAFADLGIDPLSAENIHVGFGYEQGHFVYEVEFIAEGTEYEYWIKATDGTVVKKEMDLVAGRMGQSGSIPKDIAQNQKGTDESQLGASGRASQGQQGGDVSQSGQPETSGNASQPGTSGNASQKQQGAGGTQPGAAGNAAQSQSSQGKGQISLEDAKGLALWDAGLSPTEVIFTKTGLDQDDNITVYEIEFYTIA